MIRQRNFLPLLFAALMAAALLGVLPVSAQGPVLPHAFLGTVEIAGQPAPVYTQVEGRGKDVLTGIPYNPLITEEAGKYGKPGGFDPKLLVQGPDIADGTPIEFYVNGVKAQCQEPGGQWKDSFPFKAGGVTILNLRVQSAAPGLPTPTATASPTATPTPTRTPTYVPVTPRPTSSSRLRPRPPAQRHWSRGRPPRRAAKRQPRPQRLPCHLRRRRLRWQSSRRRRRRAALPRPAPRQLRPCSRRRHRRPPPRPPWCRPPRPSRRLLRRRPRSSRAQPANRFSAPVNHPVLAALSPRHRQAAARCRAHFR